MRRSWSHSWRRPIPELRHADRVGRRQGVPGRGLRLVRLILVMFLFNTVLGEELLFRGFFLPRMNGAFGRGDWAANTAFSSPATTYTCRGRSQGRSSRCSRPRTRRSGTKARGSGSRCTAPRACSSRSWSSHSSSENHRHGRSRRLAQTRAAVCFSPTRARFRRPVPARRTTVVLGV